MILRFIGEEAVSRKLARDIFDDRPRMDLRPISFGGLRRGDDFHIVQPFNI
jgi:hypothetical protein